MADHGAEVIKIEAPGEGDPGAAYRSFWMDLARSSSVTLIAERKAWCLISMTTPSATPFSYSARPPTCSWNRPRPGAVDRLGVGYEAVRAGVPVRFDTAISGSDGEEVRSAAVRVHDLALEAESGLLSVTLRQRRQAGSSLAFPPLTFSSDFAGYPDILKVLVGASGLGSATASISAGLMSRSMAC